MWFVNLSGLHLSYVVLGSLGLEGSCSIGNVYTGLQEQM